MIEVAKGVYAETHYVGGNIGLVLTGAGAILVDTPMLPHEAEAWLGAVSSLTEEGLAYIVNTDYDAQRILGDYFFPAPVIAHEYAWNEIKSRGDTTLQRQIEIYRKKDPRVAARLADVEVKVPQVAITDKLSMHRGTRYIELVHFGGHSSATIGLYIPAESILFSGDLIVDKKHPDLSQANTNEWLEALDRIEKMNVATIVPGIGEPCGLEAIPPLKAYIGEMRDLVTEHYEGGASRRETVDKVRVTMVDRFPVPSRERDATARRIRASIERVYEEARKAAS